MHTAYVMEGSFALLVSCLLLRRAFGNGPAGMVMGVKAFIALWLVCAGFNMRLGVHQSAYSVAEELPIFLGIFALPAVIAALVWRKLA
ncbi:hypothetical protein [Variovorax sp. EBFNA2]|uniref:hypothetical protein n=1 Tax=Variovorax sp. EBFNA2 TaxID=3342097 RepID=UPI0029C081C4|nr:hypothetical protein [Variovorax boronicumulans]WPG41060.1 hypothetical protein RZE79_33775 [Variovorax boronicumulans]